MDGLMNIKFSYRVTKYNPLNRNENGNYSQDDWTSISDVGKIYNCKEFTIEEYLRVENLYISAIKKYMEYINNAYLQVELLNKWEVNLVTGRFSEYYTAEMESIYVNIREGDLVELSKIEHLIRLILRENIWCKFIYSSEFYLHFGYDYYMYLGGSKDFTEINKHITGIGLYVESYESPYWDEE